MNVISWSDQAAAVIGGHTEVEGEAGVGGAFSGLTVSRRAERSDLDSVRPRLR